jgi:hypothetical protein
LASGLVFDLKISEAADVELFSILENFDDGGEDASIVFSAFSLSVPGPGPVVPLVGL